MEFFSQTRRRLAAFAIWLAGIVIFLFFSWWNVVSASQNAEDRLIGEAGHTAAQLAAILTWPGWNFDKTSAKLVATAAMENDHIYAVRIDSKNGMLNGQRRNYLWEPIPWDDEIAENCVQGINPLKIGLENVGQVSVWLSPRMDEEENSLLIKRETYRTIFFLAIWTAALILVFWSWGDLQKLHAHISNKTDGDNTDKVEEISDQLLSENENLEASPEAELDSPPFDQKRGLRYQQSHPDSFKVTAGMFRQTFARGPALISRLYAQGEMASLCHLGHMLELAAPCIGAHNLAQAAKNMQKAINDPDCDAYALPVEECTHALEEVLYALGNGNPWKSGSPESRS